MLPKNTSASAPARKPALHSTVNKPGLILLGVATLIALVVFTWVRFMFFNSSYPQTITLDKQGNIYIAEAGSGRVEKYSPQGELLATFGSVGKDNGKFRRIYGPDEIAVDNEGNVYASQDDRDNSIQKFAPNGAFLTKWKLPRVASDVTIDSQNNVYVAIFDAPYILKFNSEGIELPALAAAKQPEGASLASASSLTVDAQDNLYVLDRMSKQIFKFDKQGQFLSKWGNELPGGYSGLDSLTVDNEGNLYLTYRYQILKYNNAGQLLLAWGDEGKGVGKFPYPLRDMDIDTQKNVYVLHPGDDQTAVEKFDSNGNFLSRKHFGLPRWLDIVFNMALPLLFGLLTIPFGRLIVRSPKLTEELLAGEPLPYKVQEAVNNKTVIPDRIDLKQLNKKANSSGLGAGANIGVLLAIVTTLPGMIIVFALIFALNDGFDTSWLGAVFAIPLAAVMVGLMVATTKKENDYYTKLLPLVNQALSTLPASNRSLFLVRPTNSAGILGWLAGFVPIITYAVCTIIGLNLGWFSVIAGFLIEAVVVVSLVTVLLLGVTLINQLVPAKQGLVKLNKAELFSLYKLVTKWIGAFALIAIGVNLLEKVLNAMLFPPFVGNGIQITYSFSLLTFVFLFIKYGFLLFALTYVPTKWIYAAYNLPDYEAALRRVSFMRRFASVMTMRVTQIGILARGNRFAEAEYLIQEGLVSDYAKQPQGLSTLLLMLSMVRMYQERCAESLYWMEKGLELQPTMQIAISDMAEIYLWAQAYPDRALQLLEHSKKSGKSMRLLGRLETYILGDLAINRAWALAQLGRHTEAEPLINEAIAKANARKNNRFQPGISSIHFRAAKIRELQGNLAGASQEYWKSYELDPTGVYGQRAALRAEMFVSGEQSQPRFLNDNN
jgi:sugar lactone lactonase YvrE/uncharacterized membrane protein (Fun14 family)